MNITFLETLHKIRQVRQIILNKYRSTKQSISRSPLHQFWSDLEALCSKYYKKIRVGDQRSALPLHIRESKVGISVQTPITLI